MSIGKLAITRGAVALSDQTSGFQSTLVDIALDASNPQLAASLAAAFNLWRRFPAARRALMLGALERIARRPANSSDVTEVVGRVEPGAMRVIGEPETWTTRRIQHESNT